MVQWAGYRVSPHLSEAVPFATDTANWQAHQPVHHCFVMSVLASSRTPQWVQVLGVHRFSVWLFRPR